ncbi:hypothetical protein BHE74_00018594 [Ensete ventricosum]|nr:hypothetical protein GW17_00054320 [Ensete ventricosum]RWW73532.1 hypothetical protein BHE74_00018594 [Ensete ventricosum]
MSGLKNYSWGPFYFIMQLLDARVSMFLLPTFCIIVRAIVFQISNFLFCHKKL